jgi:probable F420-dependent oxidoreductase
MSVHVGVGLFTVQIPQGSSRTFAQEYRDTLEMVKLAETLGFDSAWVSEHHGSSDGYLPSLLAMLAAFAAVTERIRLGTGIVLAPLHDPLRLAEDAAVVDQLSGGRLILGLGAGWREEEFRMFRVPIGERGVRTEETVEILRRAWSGRRFSFEGRVYRYDRVKVTPPAAQPGGPPIYLGGYADAVLRRAGRVADGYITDAMEDVASAVPAVEAAARAAGRDPEAIALALLQNVAISRDGSGWDAAAPGIAHQLGAYTAWDEGADTPERDTLDLPDAPEGELRAVTAAETPDEVAERLKAIVRAHADRRDLHLVVRLHYPGMSLEQACAMLEVFAQDVLPSLREGPTSR